MILNNGTDPFRWGHGCGTGYAAPGRGSGQHRLGASPQAAAWGYFKAPSGLLRIESDISGWGEVAIISGIGGLPVAPSPRPPVICPAAGRCGLRRPVAPSPRLPVPASYFFGFFGAAFLAAGLAAAAFSASAFRAASASACIFFTSPAW